MHSFRDYKTYGAIMSAVGAYLSDALRAAHKEYFGSPAYFVERARLVHGAFDRFGKDHGLAPDQTAALRTMIGRHASAHPHLMTVGLQVLCHQLPSEFHVRGEWVSPRVELLATTA